MNEGMFHIRKTAFGLAVLAALTTEAQNRPNIILLMADDLGWGDTGYNGNPVIKTPHLDQMAKEGVQFNRFYAACAVCSPTRASVLTGRNPYRMGVFTANIGILRPEEVTLPELLKEKGYVTGHYGKWHLGTLTHTEKDANRGMPGNVRDFNPPSLHGYDDAFVTESKVPTYDPMKKPVNRVKSEGWDYLKQEESYVPYGTYYWDIEGNKVTDNLDGDDSRIIMDRVLPFIERAISLKKPFFAVVWFHTPHMPCVSGPEYQQMYKGQSSLMQNYAGCITAMDDQIGRLRTFLEEKGETSNTMIWFCSDNGPEDGSPGSAGNFLERKRSLHEGGVRVPGVLVWPEKIRKGFQTDIPCITSDFLPTMVDILNIDRRKVPYQLDGISLKSLLDGKMKRRPRPIGSCFGTQVSYSDNQYKLYARDGRFQLYDIDRDPFERQAIELEVPFVFRKMQKKLLKFVSSCRSSFEGKEYGKESFERMGQVWDDPLKKQ
ncbi:MAG: sulfatase [Mangrovibacterium sp.]